MLSTLTVVLAFGYLLGLVGSIIAFRWVGERSWIILVAMYLPRFGFALPLPVVVIAAALWAPRWVLATQALSAYLALFPLMGLKLGLGHGSNAPSAETIRVVSYNIHNGRGGLDRVLTQIRVFEPDVVVLQEAYRNSTARLEGGFPGWQAYSDDQFFVASRWPIREVYVPPDFKYPGGRRGSARYVRCTLDTPLGLVDVFNVHFTSPRVGFEELRGSGLRREFESGRVFAGLARKPIESNALHRRRQAEAVGRAARASSRPVIIAGDTNLPDLSWVFATNLGSFRDGFSSVGRGLGYTFSTKHLWLRIDRVMTNEKLRVSEFRLGQSLASDHLCIFATVTADE